MSLNDDDQVTQAFAVAQLPENHHKHLLPAGEVLDILVAAILDNDAVKLASIQKLH